MPPRSRLKELFSSIRKKNGSPNVAEDREMASRITVEHPLVEHEAQPLGSTTRHVDEIQIKQSEPQNHVNSTGDEDSSKRLMVVDAAIEIMTIMKEASEASSVLNPLKVACGVTIRVLEIARGKLVNISVSKGVMEKLETHSSVFGTEVTDLEARVRQGGQHELSAEFLAALKAYLQTLEQIRQLLLDLSQRTNVDYLLRNEQDAEAVKGLDGQIDRNFQELMHQVQAYSYRMILGSSTQMTKIRISKLLEGAVDAQGERVKPIAQGTRLALIERLDDWARSNDGEKRLFWLHDEAGTGKSALAAHMAGQWQSQGVLAARFFFNKDGIRELHSLRRFCVSLAKEMAVHHPFAEALMLAKLEANPDIESGDFLQLLDKLVISTAERLGKQLLIPLVFVVDAIDECDEDDAQLLITSLVSLSKRAKNVRFLLTSRTTKEINALLDGATSVDGSGVVLLDVKHGEEQRDIDTTIYIRQELVGFPIADQNVVIECAKGLFLWATLACFAVKQSISPPKTLRRFQTNGTMKRMNLIYEAVLDSALPRNSSSREIKLLHNVLQGVTLSYTPISIFSIRTFYPGNKNERVDGEEYVELYVNKLGSIMKDGTPYLPIYLLHPTFRNFIESQQINSKYYISPTQGHHCIALACLDLMKDLTPDVFGLAKSDSPLPIHMPMESKSPMPLSLGKEAPPRYAITFWAMHAGHALTENPEFAGKIIQFFRSQFLVWVEWVGALEEMSECIGGLRSLRQNVRTLSLLGVAGVDDLLDKWCIDSLRFVFRHSITLEQCGLQAWMSALAFTPKHSLVYQAFHHKPLRPLPTLVTRHAESFHESRVLNKTSKRAEYVSFSPDGKRLLSHSSRDGASLWNVKSSKIIVELLDHAQASIVTTFSSDGSLIATGGTDMIVCLWNGYSGSLIKQLLPRQKCLPPFHFGDVVGVVFALSDSVVVSIAKTGDILRWSVSGTEHDMKPTPMSGNAHTEAMKGVIVSHDSKLAATFSDDMTVRLWEVEQAIGVGKPMEGSAKVSNAAFSLDGSRIVAGYVDGMVIVWNALTQTPVRAINHNTKYIEAIVVSPDRRIVAVCGDSFCLFDVNTGKMICPPLTGHTDAVWSVAFNKAGNRMVSGSSDTTLRIWDIRRSGEQINVEGVTLRGHTSYIHSVSLSPDGRIVASASEDGTVRLWDTDLLDNDDCDTPDHSHDKTLHLLLSGNKSRLLSAGQDATLQMWNFTTGHKIGDRMQLDQGYIRCICLSHSGTTWASGHSNGNVCLGQSGDGEVDPAIRTLPCHKEEVSCIKFTPDEENLVTCSQDNTIQVWSMVGHARVAIFNVSSGVSRIAIAPNGSYIAAASSSQMFIWDFSSLATVQDPYRTIPLEEQSNKSLWMRDVIFSPDGTTLVVSLGSHLELYDVYGMRRFGSFSMRRKVYANYGDITPDVMPAFSPDGRYLFYGPHAFDFVNMVKVGDRTVFPTQAPEALALSPISPLFLLRRVGQIYSRRWDNPVLLIPPDIAATWAPWVSFRNTLAFGTVDGRVFIVHFPEEYM